MTGTFESGSYTLTPIPNGKPIKKHGSTLFLCPETVDPYQPLSTSKLQYANLNKGLSKDRFQYANIHDSNQPVHPWKNFAQFCDINNKKFPTVCKNR